MFDILFMSDYFTYETNKSIISYVSIINNDSKNGSSPEST